VQVPLPWERLLWRGRPSAIARLPPHGRGVAYVLTDFRLVRLDGPRSREVALHDIVDVHRTVSPLDRLACTSTLVVHARGAAQPPLVLHGVARGAQLAALLEILAGGPGHGLDADAAEAALAWSPPAVDGRRRTALVGALSAAVVAAGVVLTLRGHPIAVVPGADDPIAPNGVKRRPEAIARFMQDEVMPWARVTLGPVVGGADRVTCQTCHGKDAAAHAWRMPAVSALPAPALRYEGWETWSAAMDPQMRNAIYGYLAESDNQARAGYMRDVVLPGMARLLRRPPYDFTLPYKFNRERDAFGCYHCHRIQ